MIDALTAVSSLAVVCVSIVFLYYFTDFVKKLVKMHSDLSSKLTSIQDSLKQIENNTRRK